jgi:SPP1 family predicted phage head-tail adaptor
MKWNKVATLQEVGTVKNDEGVPEEAVISEWTVFANPRYMGMESWAAAREQGLKADASLQVRSMELGKANRCTVDGVEYEIERSYDTGEYTTLTLKRRPRNARD